MIVVTAPGATSAGDEIRVPAKIAEIVSAHLFKGHAVDEGGSATYTIGPVSVDATKVDESTIKLDADTAAEDLLILDFVPAGAYV